MRFQSKWMHEGFGLRDALSTSRLVDMQSSRIDHVEFSGHFIIIGWSYPAVVSLVSTLRRRHLKTVRPIVIMDNKRPLQHWESVSSFQVSASAEVQTDGCCLCWWAVTEEKTSLVHLPFGVCATSLLCVPAGGLLSVRLQPRH